MGEGVGGSTIRACPQARLEMEGPWEHIPISDTPAREGWFGGGLVGRYSSLLGQSKFTLLHHTGPDQPQSQSVPFFGIIMCLPPPVNLALCLTLPVHLSKLIILGV